jgi:peroxin-1
VFAADFVVNVVTPQPALGVGRQVQEPQYFLLSATRIQAVRITAGGEPLSPSDASVEYKNSSILPPLSVEMLDPKLPSITLDQLGGVKEYAEKGLGHLRTCLTRRLVQSLGGSCSGLSGGGLLICGTSQNSASSVGCGKSSLALALCHQMAQFPVLAHIVIIECTALRGRRVDMVKSRLKEVFNEAACRQPSIALLENLDNLVWAPASGTEDGGGDDLHTTKLAEMICDLINCELNCNSSLALIATVSSTSALHPRLLPGRGKHYFQTILELKMPNEEQRKEILEAIVKTRGQKIDKECDLSAIAHQTIGFCPRDLDKLVEQAAHLVFKGKVRDRARYKMPHGGLSEEVGPGVKFPEWKGDDVLTESVFSEVLQSLKPVGLRTISLHSPGELTWDDVGGLKNVKKTLRETLEWPSKYPKLFAKCPLRLQSGLLLYGAPGTGKTLLAGVVAKECGLNFISIKGPELLNKYIGASEQAVRQMFERAQSAKPCVLFFDEFDSIAPKRGHDSTGVTDRVVNMFLTQLDGVESLDGVYVLAATSRPDLIDPALLRPGRLDKSLFCPLPDKLERKEILLALSQNVRMDGMNDKCFEKLARLTDHFSGADLKALLYNAQLEVIRGTEVYNRDVASTPQDVGIEKSKSFHLRTPLYGISEDDDNTFAFEELSDVPCEGNSSLRSDFGSRQTDLKMKSENDISFGWPPLNRTSSTPNKLGLSSSVSKANWSVSSDGSNIGFEYMPSILEGIKVMPPEICREMKRKYSDAYYNRTNSLSDRRTSLVSQKQKILQNNQMQARVTQEHLMTALVNMGPSLSEKERLKYESIYERFAKMKSSEEISPEHLEKKATLA